MSWTTFIILVWLYVGLNMIYRSYKDKIKLNPVYILFCLLLWPYPVIMAMKKGWKKGVERRKLMEALRKK